MERTDAIKLLAIDDKPDNLTTLSAVVRDAIPQIRVLTATSGPAGIELAVAEDPDVILLDIVMPGMDGFEVCRQLKADDRIKGTPVVFLTALKTDAASRVKALEVGAEGFLAKPLEVSELTAQIRAMTKVKAANRSQRTEKERLEVLVAERTRMMRESEERYRSMFESMASACCVYEIVYEHGRALDYRILDVNPAYERITGVRRQEAVGALASELYGLGQAPFLDVYSRVAEAGEPAEFEAWFEPLQKHLHITVGRPKPGLFSTVFTDITERMQASEAVKRGQALLAETERVGKVGGWSFNIDTMEQTWTEEVYRIHEIEIGSHPSVRAGINYYTNESRPIVERAVQRAIEYGEDYDLELAIVTAKGNRRAVHTIGKADLKNRRIYGFFQDRTEQKRAEEQRQEGFDLLKQLARLVPGVIYQYRLYPDGRSAFPYSSPGMYDIYEVTPEEVREDASVVFSRLHPDDRERVAEATFESARTLKAFHCEFRVILPKQGLRWRWSQAHPARTEDGGTLWHGTIKDITERKLAEAQREKLEEQFRMRQKMEAIGSLAGGVAHDFNNLVSVILSYTGFAMEGVREGDPLKDDLVEVKKAGERAAALTKQLLAFSRKQMLAPAVLNLNQTAKGIEKMLRRIIREDIDFVQVLSPDLGVVKADPGQMEQVFMNLVVNARDAMPEGGKLTIETSNVEIDEEYAARHVAVRPGSYVQLAVSDTGCGMDEQTRARIFEPFFTTKEKGKGTGLGLSTVYGIVKQSNGNIEVSSELGQGTTFKVCLPRDLSATTATDIKPSTVPKRTTGTETILVVEDEEALRKVAKRSLEAAGYRVLTSSDGSDALLLSAQHVGDIHLLLTDVVMPRMGGRAVAEELSKTRPTLKVVYMSGYADNEIVHQGVLDAGTHFLPKPFASADLTRKVREVLDERMPLPPR